MSHNTQHKMVAAFRRLQSGNPTHPDLAIRAAQRKLAINASTVALEAGVSRTPIASRQIGYEEICSLLYPAEASNEEHQAPRKKEVSSMTSATIIDNLRAEKRDLFEQRAKFATLLAETSIALILKDKRIRSLEEEVLRLQHSRGIIRAP